MAININKQEKTFFSTTELAKLLGISRIAVFEKIKKGTIKAQKVGRNYIIPVEELTVIDGTHISPEKKAEIEQIVKKAVNQYKKTLHLLGQE
jgi:excisionase family DNA binding protein